MAAGRRPLFIPSHAGKGHTWNPLLGAKFAVLSCHYYGLCAILITEYALECVICDYIEHVGPSVYQMVRAYSERYDPGVFERLINKSAPLVKGIADFWSKHHDI